MAMRAMRREALPRAADRRVVADRLYEQAMVLLLVADGHMRPDAAQQGLTPEALRRAAARLQLMAATVETAPVPASAVA
jgi:hypothetical protein